MLKKKNRKMDIIEYLKLTKLVINFMDNKKLRD